MKALLVLLCLFTGGILVFEIERWRRSETSSSNSTATTAVASIFESSAKPPVLPQAELYHYGNKDAGSVGFEGKIYNPNSFALTNIRVKWRIYPPIDDPKTKDIFDRFGYEQDSCSFEFAYLPPKTTYDFKTERIKARTRESMDALGYGSPALMQTTDLKPEITFSR